jgi:uncharacterized protein YgbK (DUF1537 family)
MSRQALKAAIIADDLTGALDAAAPFARRGLHTRVAIGPASLDEALRSGAEVVSVNTDSRHLPADAAAKLCADSIKSLAAHAPRLLIKKIDSTLRGNVVAECLAALDSAPGRNLLLCPAMPAQGRVLRAGILHVHGIPLPESPIGRDERSPPPKEPLLDLFRAARPHAKAALLPAGAEPHEAGPNSIVIADATEEDHLKQLARAALHNTENTLFAGAGGLTAALADAAFGPEKNARRPSDIGGSLLFLVGSRNPQSAAQSATLLAGRPDCCTLDAPDGHMDADNRACGAGIVLLRVTQADPAVEADADEVADSLAASAEKLLHTHNIGAVLATGGDTVLALLRRLDINCLEIMGEIQPGVVWSRVETGGRQTALITKAGGFGNDRLFLDVADWFGGDSLDKKGDAA